MAESRVTSWPPTNRVADYRARANELRTNAEAVTDPEARRKMLDTAALWERMADWEEKNSRHST